MLFAVIVPIASFMHVDAARASVSLAATYDADENLQTAISCSGLDSKCSGELDADFKELLCRVNGVPYSFPSTANRIGTFCNSTSMQQEVVKQARGTRPIIHPQAVELAITYLMFKEAHGSKFEIDMYREMTAADFILRLLTKRPLAFLGKRDRFLLRDGRKGEGVGSLYSFDNIGTYAEKEPLTFSEYLSYEEMEVSALLGVSTPTFFINNGNRLNRCIEKTGHSTKGILVGLVGCRFERERKMDWKHMLVTKSQNVKENGYGKDADKKSSLLHLWAKFYGVTHFPTYDEAMSQRAQGSERYIEIGSTGDKYLDAHVYRARCELMAEMFLAEANDRAVAVGSTAFCHVVGLGLGVWKISRKQSRIQTQAYITVAQRMNLGHVGVLFFDRPSSSCGEVCKNTTIRSKDGSDLRLIFGKRKPSSVIQETVFGFRKWLLIAQYAWDGNSYPGNEYWLGAKFFGASGDPAAACSSFIPELQNPDVNADAFTNDRIQVMPPDSAMENSLRACTRDTGGTCFFAKCDTSRSAECDSGKCMCPIGVCQREGKCDHDRDGVELPIVSTSLECAKSICDHDAEGTSIVTTTSGELPIIARDESQENDVQVGTKEQDSENKTAGRRRRMANSMQLR